MKLHKKGRLLKLFMLTPVPLTSVLLVANSCSSKHNDIFKGNNTKTFVNQIKSLYASSSEKDFVIFWQKNLDRALEIAAQMYFGFAVGTKDSNDAYGVIKTLVTTAINKNSAFYLAPDYTTAQKANFVNQVALNVAIYALINLATAYSYLDYFDKTKSASNAVFNSKGSYNPLQTPTSNDPISALLYVLASAAKLPDISSKLIVPKTNLISTNFATLIYAYVSNFLNKKDEANNPLYLFETSTYTKALTFDLQPLNINQTLNATNPWKYKINFTALNANYEIDTLSTTNNQALQFQSFKTVTDANIPKTNKIAISPALSAVANEFYYNFNLWTLKQPSDKNTLADYLKTDDVNSVIDELLSTYYQSEAVSSLGDLVNKLISSSGDNVFSTTQGANWASQGLVTSYANDITNILRKFFLTLIIITALYNSANQSTLAAIMPNGDVAPTSTWGSALKYFNENDTTNNVVGNFYSLDVSRKISLSMRNFFSNNNNISASDKTVLALLAPVSNVTKITLNKINFNPLTSGASPQNYQISIQFGASSLTRFLFTLAMKCQYSSDFNRPVFDEVNYGV